MGSPLWVISLDNILIVSLKQQELRTLVFCLSTGKITLLLGACFAEICSSLCTPSNWLMPAHANYFILQYLFCSYLFSSSIFFACTHLDCKTVVCQQDFLVFPFDGQVAFIPLL